jgi:hypothetical protein
MRLPLLTDIVRSDLPRILNSRQDRFVASGAGTAVMSGLPFSDDSHKYYTIFRAGNRLERRDLTSSALLK